MRDVKRTGAPRLNALINVLFLAVGIILAGDQPDYSALRASAWNQDPATDFRSLRYASVGLPTYDPYFSVSEDYRYTLAEVRNGVSDEVK